MQYTINQLYQHLNEKVNTIYDTFKGFFGESNVDLQPSVNKDTAISYIIAELLRKDVKLNLEDKEYNTNYDVPDHAIETLEAEFATSRYIIYVWWNRVTITNENNKSVNIQDLYAKIEIQGNGRIPYENHGFLLNRATYTKEQFLSDYMHSHICTIPKDNFTRFENPCLGTGPINNTIMSLKNDYDEVTWMLFCEELALYVTVESLTGRPYRYLEHISGGKKILSNYIDYDLVNRVSPNIFLNCFSNKDLKDFIKYYLQKGHLSITYRNGKYSCGMSFYEYTIDISNAFIDYYNSYLIKKQKVDNLFTGGLLTRVLVVNGKFYSNENTFQHLDRYRNKFVLKFRGRDILTTITEEAESESTITTVLDNNTAMYILRNILRIINLKYKNEHKYYTTGNSQDSSPVKERVIYL